MADDLQPCHDCGAEPGQPRFDGDALTGWDQHDPHPGEDCGQDVWSGRWPGMDDAIRLGWYARFAPFADPSWVPYGPDDPGARPDLNRLAIDGKWNRELLRWEARDG
jgi:hypothetical protein